MTIEKSTHFGLNQFFLDECLGLLHAHFLLLSLDKLVESTVIMT